MGALVRKVGEGWESGNEEWESGGEGCKVRMRSGRVGGNGSELRGWSEG